MHYLFLDNALFYILCFFDIFFSSAFKIEYIFGLRQTHSTMGVPAHSSFILPKTFLFAFEWSRCSFGYSLVSFVSFDVFVDVICFDFKLKAVCVCVQELAPLVVLLFQMVVENVVQQDLALVKDSHPRVDRLVEQQPAFAYIDSNQVV